MFSCRGGSSCSCWGCDSPGRRLQQCQAGDESRCQNVEVTGPVGCAGDGVSAVSACVRVRGQRQGCGHHCPATIQVKKKKKEEKKRKTHLVGFASRA